MAAKFEIRQPKAGQYTWVLTSQGRTLAISEPYSRRGLAEKAIVAFRMAAINAPVIDTTVPVARPTTRRAARSVGRALAKAVVKGGRAVEKVEKTAAKTTNRAAKKVAQATAEKPAGSKRAAGSQKRSSRTH